MALNLELKNIPKLQAKVFEFNSETYYKKTERPFDTSINLEGLVPAETYDYDYSSIAPSKKHTETLEFPRIGKGKRGLFIVEFIGNGYSARAVIKKGSLQMISKPSIGGHLCYLVDENREIVKQEGSGIYFGKEFFKVQDKGKIFIPYAKISQNGKAILISCEMAQLCDFTRLSEAYSMTTSFHLNSESVLTGQEAQIVIKPILKINNRMAGVDLLRNCKVTLVTNSYNDDLPVTKIFENVKFTN